MTYSLWTPVKTTVDVAAADPVTAELQAQAAKLDDIKVDGATLVQELKDHAAANGVSHATEIQLLEALLSQGPVTPQETYQLIEQIRDAVQSIQTDVPTLGSTVLDGLVKSTNNTVSAVEAAAATSERLHEQEMALLRAQDEIEVKNIGTHVEQQFALGTGSYQLLIPEGASKLLIRLMTPDGSAPTKGFEVNGLNKPPGYVVSQRAELVGKDLFPINQQRVRVNAPGHVLEWEYESQAEALDFVLSVYQGNAYVAMVEDGPGQFSEPAQAAPPDDPSQV